MIYDILFQISSNGYFSFDRRVSYSSPQLFTSSSPQNHIVAPYWANNDISNRVGNVSYEVHSSGASSEVLDSVSTFISQQKLVQFSGSWMLLAEWNGVPQFGGSLTDVSLNVNRPLGVCDYGLLLAKVIRSDTVYCF